jgi:hypothetical protein
MHPELTRALANARIAELRRSRPAAKLRYGRGIAKKLRG